ncbi:MAG: flavodoxin domain-containing protein [Candidatus Omnitrophica bacterium]|nr:flavodoxin domain-containing protein [Candidatus Omnitrophota bacterium]MDD5488051.1 flavodoxin domain-containing protein [Candidatus Omnitrophota bacterium]
MKKIIVLYFSGTGNTKRMAEYVSEGAKDVPGTDVDVRSVEDFRVEELEAFDGMIIGSPTYYGTMAYQIKKLLDDSVVLHGRLVGRAGAAFSSSANIGGGNETTILSILSAMLIHGMVVQGMEKGGHYGTVAIGRPDKRAEEQCRELGRRVAELVQKVR